MSWCKMFQWSEEQVMAAPCESQNNCSVRDIERELDSEQSVSHIFCKHILHESDGIVFFFSNHPFKDTL